MDFINKILDDKRLIRNIISVSIWFTVILAGIVYFAFVSNFDWENFDWQGFTVLSILFTISIFSIRLDSKDRGFSDECEQNEEIVKLIQTMKDNRISVDEVDEGINFLNNYNEEQQKLANQELTSKKIEKLQTKLGKRIQKNKDIKSIQKQINYLREHPVFNKSFEPIRMSDIISVYQDVDGQSYIDRNSIHSDPRKTGNTRSFVWILLRSIVAGSIGLGFMWNEDKWTIMTYFALLIVSGVFTLFSQYAFTRRETGTVYLDRLDTRVGVQLQLKKHLGKEKKINE